MKKLLLLLVFVYSQALGQTAELVKDINSLPTSVPQIEKYHRLNATTLLFKASDGIQTSLWKTDGTATGTTIVKGSIDWTNMVTLNGYAYFISDDKLWRTDGTMNGTTVVVQPTTYSITRPITIVGGIIYFSSDSGLWRSDGTVGGTYLVKSIGCKNLIDVNGTLFFTATTNIYGQEELWKSDGTTAGTVLVKNITPDSDVRDLTVVNNILFFITGNPSLQGGKLWKSDGTTAGTIILNSNNLQTANYLSKLNNKLIFSGDDGLDITSTGHQLWESDGTLAGTQILKTIFVNRITNGEGTILESSRPRYLTAVNNQVFFVADIAPFNGISLWKTDGTTAGTVFVKSFNTDPISLANVNGTLFFAGGGDFPYDVELWKSNGTEAGTVRVKDINPGTSASTDYKINSVGPNNFTFFNATDGVNAYQLWKSDGSETGTTLVKIINTSTASSRIDNLIDVNGTLFFQANGQTNTTDLWKSNGTSTGTVSVYPSNSIPLAHGNGTLFFARYTYQPQNTKHSLWKSDGTTTGTTEVKNREVDYGFGDYIKKGIFFNGLLYFVSFVTFSNGISGDRELWKSDGTENGTVKVKDINPNDGSAFGGGNDPNFFIFNNALYFVAYSPNNGSEIWKTDGTETGTVLLKNINETGDIYTYIHYDQSLYFTELNGYMYFLANEGSNTVQLWRTDGTTAGTVKITTAATHTTVFRQLVNVNGTLFLSDSNGSIWKSNGTASGTTLVKVFSYLSWYLTNVAGKLFFFASDGVNGRELWKSDGTEAGTTMVKDIYPNGTSSVGQYTGDGTEIPPVVNNGVFYFVANSPTTGVELWQSDGTEEGTAVLEAFSLTNSALPRFLTVSNNTVFFSALSEKGRELWKVSPCISLPNPPSATGVTIGEGTSTTLSANCTGATVKWFNQSVGGTTLATGNYTTPILYTNTTYYAACSNGPTCVSTRTSVLVTVTVFPPTQPANFTTSTSSLCQGASNIVYTVPNVSGVTYNWTYSGTGATFSSITNSVSVNFANNATSGNLSVTATNSAGTSPARTLAVTVNTVPTIPSASGVTIASGSTANLTATGCTTYKWYDQASAGNLLFTGQNFTTPPLSASINYYVACNNGAMCESGRTVVSVTVSCSASNVTISPMVSNSGPVNAGQTVNLTAINLAPRGQAITLSSASSQYIEVPQGLPNNNFTIEMWIKASQANVGIFETGSTPLSNLGSDRHIYLEGGILKARIIPEAIPGFSSGKTLNDNQWHHIAITHTTTGGVGSAMYVDGALTATFATNVVCDGSLPVFRIGVEQNTGWFNANPNNFFTGQIDQVRIWNVVRTSSEIRGTAQLETPSSNTGIVYQSNLNGNANASIGTNGSLINAPTFTNVTHYTYAWTGQNAPTASNNETQTTTGAAGTSYTLNVTPAICGTVITGTSTVTVNGGLPQPDPIVGSNVACQGRAGLNYLVTAVAGATSYTWTYSGTGVSFVGGISNTRTITLDFSFAATSGTLSVTANNASGSSQATTLAISINSAPAAPTTSGVTISQGAVANLAATGCSIYKWYATATTGTALFTGQNFTTPALTSTTNYYVACSPGTSCESPRVLVTVTVPCPPGNLPITTNYGNGVTISPQANSATGTITATNQITGTAQITYQARSVTLSPGFRAQPTAGGYFKVAIGGCN